MAGARPSGRGLLTFQVDKRQVDEMMRRGEMALEPQSMAFFLKSSVEPYLQGRARDRFAREGDDVSGKWAPLKDSTENIRASLGYGAAHPINVRTGQLENFITKAPTNVTVGAMGGASLVMPGSQPTGQLQRKLSTAQRGKDSPNTVPRPVLGLGVRDLEATMVLMSNYLTRVLSGGKLGPGRLI